MSTETKVLQKDSEKDSEKVKTETQILRESLGFEKIKNGKLKKVLKQRIDKIEFKEVKDKILGMLYMICEFSSDGNLVARGVSIRSLLDAFNKKKGKNRAFGRAVKALVSKTSTEPIRKEFDYEVLVSRSLTCKDELTEKRFKKIEPFLLNVKRVGGKIFYKVDSLLPLLMASNKFDFKSEFDPSPVILYPPITQ